MKKTVCVLLALVLSLGCLVCITGCGAKTELPKNAMFILQGEETGPYFFFGNEDQSCHFSLSIAMSYAATGSYTLRGKTLTAVLSGDPQTTVTLRLRSNNTLVVRGISPAPAEEGLLSNIRPGDTYVLREFETDPLFETVCPAEEALEWAKENGFTVFENTKLAANANAWDAFYKDVSAGKAASVMLAKYYAVPQTVSEEWYEAEKEESPVLFFVRLQYDGAAFTVSVRNSKLQTLDYEKHFSHLLHFTGEAPALAAYSEYDAYVLVNDPTATWEGIQEGLLSSQADAGYEHYTVYLDLID